ncbi:MAG: aromatic ring-hydroxylating dioxygenase subunit alpha [Phycisphaeraceae bacterium]|nr:aromatic ring-hydroxylating dioxygenase subunit alpha [Phycisphaeraceae bacterium]MCW5755231.1 aromatic ring-hydroxylating dioxygenase subunit alpha [Phycisphaeraceae bacterium]
MPRTITIDPDITLANTLPGWFYSAHDMHERCRERIFARSWQYIGDLEDVRTPGDVRPCTLLEGCLDEPLVLTRDEADHLHCLSNVCTHRANLVVQQPGKATMLRCGYHGRRFGLDGRFRSMPEFDRVRGFPSAKDDLARLSLHAWGNWLFTAIDPALPFEAWISPVEQRVGRLPLHEFRHQPSMSRDYLVKCNWALYCENYLEGFHIPFVHDALAGTLDYAKYETELHPWGNLQIGIAKGGEECFDADEITESEASAGSAVAAYYFWLWPNLMLNFYPWGLSVNIVKPLGVDRTRVCFRSYVWRPERLGRGAGADLDRVEREDEAIVESVQRGAASRLYDRGRYAPDREQGVHQFHRMLAEAVGDGR